MDLPRPAGEKSQATPFVTHERMGQNIGVQRKVLARVIGVEKRVGNNEKKITLLKNILKAQKSNLGDKIKGGSSLDQSIQSITNTVTDISETLKNRHKWEKEQAAKEGIELEQSQRDKAEKGSEAKAFTGLKKTSQKVLKPVQSIFEKILGVIKKLILGKVVMELFNWFTDEQNKGKVKSIVKFFKDWWPTLLAAYLLFGNAFGRFVVKTLAQVGIWIAKSIPAMIKALAAALAKLKAMKWLKLLGGGRGLKALKIGGIIGGGIVLTDRIMNPEDLTDDQNQGEQQQTQNQGGEQTQFSTGGFVSGPAGVDRVPAKLTAGEFVMSRGAVQKYGAETLESMNAMGGGTNMPMGGGYFGGGQVIKPNAKEKELISAGKIVEPIVKPGTIKSYQDAIDAGVKIEDNIMGNMRSGKIRWSEKLPRGLFGKQKYATMGTEWINDGFGEDHAKVLAMSTKDFVNKTMGWSASPKATSAKGDAGGGFMSNFLGGSLPTQGATGATGAAGASGAKGETGAGGKSWWDPLGVFTGKDKKEPPEQPITKKTKAALSVAAKPDASKVARGSGGGQGDKIPSINPAAKRSTNKMKTLGISV